MSDSVISGNSLKNEKTKATQILIDNEDESLSIHGYKSQLTKCIIVYIFYFVTVGILRLIFHWFPIWQLYATHSKCPLSDATKILVVDKYRAKYTTYYVEKVKILDARCQGDSTSNSAPNLLVVYLDNGRKIESSEIRMVSCKHINYVWNHDSSEFARLCGIDQNRKCDEFHESEGLTTDQQFTRGITYGKNETLVPIQTVLSLLFLEALTPFYMFQVFSLTVWFVEGYYYYTIAIVAMSVFGISSSIIQTRRNQRTLRELHTTERVSVCRGNGNFEDIVSCSLVPGDIIEIPKKGCVVQCDAVLLSGTCIVNESMLTGESVPVTKTTIPKTDSIYDVKGDSFHTLYCGTKVIQTQSTDGEKVLALVLRTGYLTTKGELVRSILYPPPSDFKFDQDSYKFIGILATIAFAGFLYTVISKSDRSIAASDIIIKALDVFTIVIPPALPAAMTVGKLYALSRLKKHKIFCLNSRVINVSGSIDCVCFDKTGTLTEDGLEMWGVVPINGTRMGNPIRILEALPQNSDFLMGMATCHSIVVMDEQLLGDPLDMKVFESTGYSLTGSNLVQSQVNNFGECEIQLEICLRFQFLSALQRMSVITKDLTSSNFKVYCKGSPEMITSLSKPETVPSGIAETLKEYTEKGYRVIAMASKFLDSSINVNNLMRADVEQDLCFLGLIILENCVKSKTPQVIDVLRKAALKTIMITGDNYLTAISVAKECGIISENEVVVGVEIKVSVLEKPTLTFTVNHSPSPKSKNTDLESGCNVEHKFAMTGANWSLLHQHFPDKIPVIIEKGAVFARMSGIQKQQLIQELQKLGYFVAMCGDGANDCGALKAAHVGISLSDEESSIASPFTSKTNDITCVPRIITEGRAALTTSITVFKFMVCYSLTQFTSVVVLYGIDSNLTQIEFLFIDVCLILNLVSILGKTEAYQGPLDKKRPLSSLLCFTCVSSITLQALLTILVQVLSYKLVQTLDWFVPFKFDPENNGYFSCYENYAVFSVSVFQYIILAITFSKGKPFRKPIYTNKLLMFSIILSTIVCSYIITYPADWIVSVLELMLPPKLDFTPVIAGLLGCQLIFSLLFEDVLLAHVFDSSIWKNVVHSISSSKKLTDNKQNLQLPFLVRYANSRRSITFENHSRKRSEKNEHCYSNDAFKIS